MDVQGGRAPIDPIRRHPSLKAAFAIEDYTQGAVPARAWVQGEAV